MSGNLVRGFAVVSATAVTTVGAVTGVAQSSTGQSVNDAETTGSGSTLLADIPMGQQARIQTASLTQQADAQAIAADNSVRETAAEAARKQAAKDAIAKQKEAKQKEAQQKALQDAKDRQEAQQQAGSSSTGSSSTGPSSLAPQSSYTVAQVQAIARQMVPGDQFQCFSNIVDHESGWNHKAVNPSSGAYGLVQAYPGSKMSSAGADWQTNPATQIKWGLNYMNARYGSPCGAWAFWQANGSY
ncbi:transglycosylase SLT domain-containing protein [Streptomyces ipomoeae]|uniref:aggregation-promoting factor C-terminal-like domain-containing protein n=1 Tax=Streptomyces ipomoeae TaxID=103232 RepID=UPI0006628259|nr:transglycosylase SLT domain-containing protein [Streptomyces ipomoeae]MDX2692398.1 transglycosylase SLT domain-containing protein [Streptomyces ipomoeae]MDX2819772.1 transglycosylase SLT domain-containing protein [Streptomyces ipomoeae]MDX2838078.1 transglycosylase SLT domain-containing protein [Streptomyces ipomoeae]MDX2872398.1 transglycosylase SLT domain-containing protein [Streptomyces ipomoeae]